MAATVKLEVTEGPMKGKVHVIEEHDTFLLGRSGDCHIKFPDSDPTASRHHFILEANPPDARIRDVGSRNGTWVNGLKIGARAELESPEQGAQRHYPEVDLKDGDQIKAGETVLVVRVHVPAVCSQCHSPIAGSDHKQCVWLDGIFICLECKKKLFSLNQQPKVPEPIRCQKCGKNVVTEVGQHRRGDYVCEACRNRAEADPMQLLQQLLVPKAAATQPPKISGYDIEKQLGKGGFGAVYLARSNSSGRHVAIKVMLARVAVDEKARKQFLNEVELTKSLRHDHIVTLHDHGSVGGVFYFIMDYCEGGSIDGLMHRRGGRLQLSEAGPLMLQTLEGLAYIHANNKVHRDLKPGNILLARSEGRWSVKISDLGLAKDFQRAGLSGMTVTGQMAGTPPFMPREQVTNFKRVKPPADIWSIGATFYNMLTGQFPRNCPRDKDALEIILHEPIVSILNRDSSIPRNLAEVIDRSISDKADERYQNAAEMRRALTSVL